MSTSISTDSELWALFGKHRHPNETLEQFLFRMVKLAVHLQEAIDDLATTSEPLWPIQR